MTTKKRSTKRTDFGARLPNGGEATGWFYPDGWYVYYDEVASFTEADWKYIDGLIRDGIARDILPDLTERP